MEVIVRLKCSDFKHPTFERSIIAFTRSLVYFCRSCLPLTQIVNQCRLLFWKKCFCFSSDNRNLMTLAIRSFESTDAAV